jgi:hypothetical protein
MPQPNSFDPSVPPPLAKRRCPICGELMFLVTIEPTDTKGFDQRTFECTACPYAETTTVKF